MGPVSLQSKDRSTNGEQIQAEISILAQRILLAEPLTFAKTIIVYCAIDDSPPAQIVNELFLDHELLLDILLFL